MLGLRVLLAFATLSCVATQRPEDCPQNTSCVLGSECRRRVNATGGTVDITKLRRCGFMGSNPKLCCTVTTPVPSTTARPYFAASSPTTSTQRTTSRPTTAAPRPQITAATRLPTANSQTTTTKRPAPVIEPNVGVHALSSSLHNKPHQPPQTVFLSENITDVRITNREPPFGSNSYSPGSYPGANQVNSGHSGPVSFSQQAVLRPGTDANRPKDLLRHINFKLLPRCGRNADESFDRAQVGVQRASLGEHPWVAQLGELRTASNFRVLCSGSVISKKYILTAGLCIKQELTHVKLGEFNIDTEPDCSKVDEDCADFTHIIEIGEKIRHERYDKPYAQNDIGLVRLKRPLPHLFTSYIRPVCIPLKQEVDVMNDFPKTYLTSIGWGLTHAVNKPRFQILQKAHLPLVKNRDCASLQASSLLKKITESQMCANSSDHSSTACQGDTGGPLMIVTNGYGGQSEEAVYMQVGIVSHGPGECGVNAPPAILTRVSSYAEWILDNIRE